MDEIVATLFSIGGAVLFLKTLGDLVNAFESTGWPSVEGVIVISRLEVSLDERERRSFSAHIRYRYTVDGEELEGSHGAFTSGHSAQELCDRFRAGDPVTVHYDPLKPARSLLEPGVTPHLIVALIVGAVLFAAGMSLPH
jgi:hypothetical protein